MNKPKVYVTDSEFPDYSYELDVISRAGGELIGRQCKTEQDVIDRCRDAVALINQYAPITRKVLESLPNLKVVSRMGIGVNNVDVEAATDLGICVSNVPDASVEEVSNHALAFILNITRKISQQDCAAKRKGAWGIGAAKPVRRAAGQTVGLLSFGQIARRLAQKVQALNMRVVFYDPYIPPDVAARFNAESVSLEELLKRADIISVHSPLTPETRHMIGERQFALMKEGAFIVNTGRGGIIDEGALLKALQGGRIAGAALDVFEREPVEPDNPLLALPNLLVTTHSAWYSEEALVEIRNKTAQGAAEVITGTMPTYLVNKSIKKIRN